ncbi:MAG: hypothetical protein ACFE0Q_07105 [Anaerolineae bacterium]
MQKIGTVKFVQVQQDQMKAVEGDVRVYRPDPLQTVTSLHLTATGIVGIASSGLKVTDVHNEAHPRSRYRGDNKISLGFVQHYEQMRGRFGDHLKDGVGGENIIIDTGGDLPAMHRYRRFFLKHGEQLTELKRMIPAPPCREFSVFCLQVPQCADEIKATLQFLADGLRGYYADVMPAPDQAIVVQAGDEFLATL